MREETYNNETLRQYLLGSLPAEKVELFDELSITDDEFANSLAAAENDLVDSYVRGELTGSALANFRSSYLITADKRERVCFAQSLRDFCERSAAAEVDNSLAQSATVTSGEPDKFSPGNIFSRLRLMQWGIAAAMVVLIAVAWLAYYNLRIGRQNSDGRVDTEAKKETNADKGSEVAAVKEQVATTQGERERLEQEANKQKQELTKVEQTPKNRKPTPSGQGVIAALVLSPQVRGIGQFPTFSLPAKAEVVVVQLQLEPSDYSTYSVELLKESSQVLWRSNKIKASGRTLKITFPARLLAPEVFVLQVYGVAPGKSEALGAYPFKVVE